jgi:DNA polymerase-3 subunit delta
MTAKKTSDPVAALEASLSEGSSAALYLVVGDRVLSEPGAMRIANALAAQVGCKVEVHVRPASISKVLADLKTYSLFAPAKVVVAVETALLADESAAAQMIDEVLETLPLSAADPEALSQRERRAASQLLHILRLFRIDVLPGSVDEVLSQLPDIALEGAKGPGRQRKRGRKQIETAREQLAALLEVARQTDLRGRAETDAGELLEIVQRGLPKGHALILAESAVAPRHPLVEALKELRSIAIVGGVQTAKKGGWQGLEQLAAQLEGETGVAIAPRALNELARRTLQTVRIRGRDSASAVSADSSARLAAEYRKLANLAGSDKIGLDLVQASVEDRGEEDAWLTLDAIGAGRSDDALRRIQRLLTSSEDTLGERLSFFSLLASFCRQLTALAEAIDRTGIERRQTSYNDFKTRLAPKLQADLPSGLKNPLGGLHPFRLYRAYGVACRMPAGVMARLPARVLETERQLKGDSDQPDVALTALVCDLTTSVGKTA